MASTRNHHSVTDPSDWILRFESQIASGATVLDLACGGGRHGRLFLAKGCKVTFVDKNTDQVADLSDTPAAEIQRIDLESGGTWPFPNRLFDAIVVTNYLWRPILPDIAASIAPDGILLYETFAEGNEAFGRPRNPDFLLRTGELLDMARGRLDVLAYEQRRLEVPSPRVVQRLAARRPS